MTMAFPFDTQRRTFFIMSPVLRSVNLTASVFASLKDNSSGFDTAIVSIYKFDDYSFLPFATIRSIERLTR